MLELINIKKKYNNQEVLKGVSLKFPNKGLISIVGESGSGKSTLLNIIGLIEKQDSGHLIIDNVDVINFKNKDIDNYHKNYISFIFQQYNLVENLNVINNINISRDSKDINSIVRMLRIKQILTKKVNKLSGGEKQRVVIARALTSNPKVILADEPTGALDTKNRKIVMNILKDISKDILVIMVTHNMKDAYSYSDRIIELKDGLIYKDTNKKNIKSDYKLNLIKSKISKFKLIKIALNNMKSKLKRNIVTSIAFSIGLISLLLVLTISSGFSEAIDKASRDTLSKYPIIISNSSTNIDEGLNDVLNTKNVDDNKVYSRKYTVVNNIDNKLIDNINKLNSYYDYVVYEYNKDIIYSSFNSNLVYDEFNIIAGRKIEKDNEINIVIDRRNSIDEYLLNYFNLNKNKYDYNELINYEYNGKKIIGILKAKEDSIMDDSSFILAKYNGDVPDSIYIYPKDYSNKKRITKYLDNIDINYVDYSSSVKSISESLVKAVSVVLICFSFISLIVSTIMIGIITYINIVEKTKEIGILRSLGFSNSNVKFIFLFESILIGLLSSIISISLICLLSIPINNLLLEITGISNIFLININNLIIILCLSVFLCIIGARIPLRGISKMNIIDTIRYE